MAIILSSRIPYDSQNPYRKKRPMTSKIIFLSMEGSVTEEEYFEWISQIFGELKSKIQFISVAEDAVHTKAKYRTPEQNCMLGMSRPKQLVEKIDKFKREQEEKYQFERYQDEFWIVTDIDANLEKELIMDFHAALQDCDQKGYGYAISNPFFELWLLLHHDDVTEEDRKYAVTDNQRYHKTGHFRERLCDLNVPLKDKKHIQQDHYTKEKVIKAVHRARNLYKGKGEWYPRYLATTVFCLVHKMIEMLPENQYRNLMSEKK